jgi:hypothetical protein
MIFLNGRDYVRTLEDEAAEASHRRMQRERHKRDTRIANDRRHRSR